MKRIIPVLFILLVLVEVCHSATSKTPLKNGLLQGDLDGGGNRITNVSRFVGKISGTNVDPASINSSNIDAATVSLFTASGVGDYRFATIADMKSVSHTLLHDGDTALVGGYYSAGDRGGGNFRYVSASTLVDDGGAAIKPTSNPATGRWVRYLVDGPANVKMWGAKGDFVYYINVPYGNDTKAIQAAFDAVAGFGSYPLNCGEMLFPTGGYLITNTIRFAEQLDVHGEGVLNNSMVFMSNTWGHDMFQTISASNYLAGVAEYIGEQYLTCSTLTHSGTTATFTATSPYYNAGVGQVMTISGATPSAYNGDFVITNMSGSSFTYTLLSDPGANASGTITAYSSFYSHAFDGEINFHNLDVGFISADTFAHNNTSNACLVVLRPGEENTIHNIITSGGAYGLLVLEPGAPGIRVRDGSFNGAAAGGIGIVSYSKTPPAGGPVSLIAISGDNRTEDAVTNSSLVLISNVMCNVMIDTMKVEAVWGGGVVRYVKPNGIQTDSTDICGYLDIRNITYNRGFSHGELRSDLVHLTQITNGLANRSPTVCLQNANITGGVTNLLWDEIADRNLPTLGIGGGGGLVQQTILLPLIYNGYRQNTTNIWKQTHSTMINGTREYYMFTPPTNGWYRVMGPGNQQHLGCNLIVTSVGRQKSEVQFSVAANTIPQLSVSRYSGTNFSEVPVVDKVRVFGYFDEGGGVSCYADIHVSNSGKLITLASDLEDVFDYTRNGNLLSPRYGVRDKLPDTDPSSTTNQIILTAPP